MIRSEIPRFVKRLRATSPSLSIWFRQPKGGLSQICEPDGRTNPKANEAMLRKSIFFSEAYGSRLISRLTINPSRRFGRRPLFLIGTVGRAYLLTGAACGRILPVRTGGVHVLSWPTPASPDCIVDCLQSTRCRRSGLMSSRSAPDPPGHGITEPGHIPISGIALGGLHKAVTFGSRRDISVRVRDTTRMQ